MINIIDYNVIDTQKIKFNKPDKVKGGSYMSLAEYNGEPIYIQTPRLLSKGILKHDTRCNLELEFDKNHWNFYEFITNLDDHNVIQIQKNSGEWFSKEFPLDIVEEFYSTPIKIGRGNKPPSLKIKIPVVKGNLSCSIYNSNNNLITYNDINPESKILCVLKLQGLRYLKQQVICEWVPIQIKVFQKGHDNIYLINDNLLSDIESTEKVDNNETYEMVNDDFVNINDDLDNINLQHPESVEPNDDLDNINLQHPESVEPNDDLVNINDDTDNINLQHPESVEPNDDLDNINDDTDNINLQHPESVEPNDDFTETTNFNELELLKHNYEKMINEKNSIIEDLQNKFIKLKDFIN